MENEPLLRIVYTGTIYEGNQNPRKMFQAISELIAEGVYKPEEISVDIYGRDNGCGNGAIKEFGLETVVKKHGVVPMAIVKEKQREASVLWIMGWDGAVKKYGFIFKSLCLLTGDWGLFSRTREFAKYYKETYGFVFKVLCWLMRDKKTLEYAKEYNKECGEMGENGVIPLKIYEYIAAGKPVLATGGHRDELARIIEDSKIGVCCDTVEEIKYNLMSL